MKTQIVKLALLALVSGVVVTGCKKDKVEENDNEVITTMELHFTQQGTGTQVTYKFDDPDGPGGTAPTKDVVILAPNKVYNMEIILLDKTKNPVDTVSEEVANEEPEDHRFYFEPSGSGNIAVGSLDNDPAGIPLGINSVWTTTTATTTGKMKITLRHYPNGGKAAGDLVTSTKSSTDREVGYSKTGENV